MLFPVGCLGTSLEVCPPEGRQAMKRNTDGPTMIDGVALGPDAAAAVALLAPRGALSGPLLKHVRAKLDRVIP
jgi:hypothetical protein